MQKFEKTSFIFGSGTKLKKLQFMLEVKYLNRKLDIVYSNFSIKIID